MDDAEDTALDVARDEPWLNELVDCLAALLQEPPQPAHKAKVYRAMATACRGQGMAVVETLLGALLATQPTAFRFKHLASRIIRFGLEQLWPAGEGGAARLAARGTAASLGRKTVAHVLPIRSRDLLLLIQRASLSLEDLGGADALIQFIQRLLAMPDRSHEIEATLITRFRLPTDPLVPAAAAAMTAALRGERPAVTPVALTRLLTAVPLVAAPPLLDRCAIARTSLRRALALHRACAALHPGSWQHNT